MHPKVRNDLGILGSSLGGLISCYAGKNLICIDIVMPINSFLVWTRSKVYSKGGCMSSSFWWNNEDFNNQILVNHPTPNNHVTIYIDSGDSGNDNDDEAVSPSKDTTQQKCGSNSQLLANDSSSRSLLKNRIHFERRFDVLSRSRWHAQWDVLVRDYINFSCFT